MGAGLIRAAMLACALATAMPASGARRDPDSDSTPPTAADFGAIPAVSGVKLAPNGKLIAAEGVIAGKQMVVLTGAGAEHGPVRTYPMPEKQKLQWLRWAGSDRLLVSVSTQTRIYDEDYRMTRLLMLDLKTGKASIIGPKEQGLFGDDIVHVDPAGKFLLLNTQATIFEYPGVYRVDLDTGKSHRIVSPQEDVWSWFADGDGVVRAGMGSRGKQWWLLYRAGADSDFRRIKRAIKDDDTQIDRFAPLNGSDQGYAIAAGTSGRFGLYRYDFKTDRLGDALYENATVDIDDFDLSPAGELVSVSYTDDRPQVAWFEPEFKKLQARIDRALPRKTNRVVSMSADRVQMLVWSGGADDPGMFYFYDRKTNNMAAFAAPYEKLLDKKLSAMEPVRYKARDGLEIRGYLTLPQGRGDKDLPLIVMPHGGPFARDSWSYDPWVQFLASKGYAVLQPNFRGSTGFGRDFVEKGVGQWGRGMQDDIDDGVKWLAGRGTIDTKRVCIMGASFGGYAAMWGAVRNPEMYRCAISFAGISDVESMLKYDKKAMAAPRYFRDWRARVQGDKSFELDQISPIKQVEKMTVPILLAHGADDDNVPSSQSRRLHEALLRLGRSHEYVVYKGEGHGFQDPVNGTDFLMRVGKFLDQHNPS